MRLLHIAQAMMPSFNLLPWRERRDGERRRNALIAIGAGVLLSAGLIATMEVVFLHRLKEARERLSHIRSAIATEEQTAAPRDDLKSANAELAANLQTVRRILKNNRAVHSWLADLPTSIPRDLYLTQLRLTDEGWEISGVASDPEQAARLLGRLRAMPAVLEVRFEQLQSETDRSRQFMLVGRLRQ